MKNDDLITLMKSKYNIETDLTQKSKESTDGNVYVVYGKNDQSKYVVKIYDNRAHAESMVKLHTYLNEYGLNAPNIIKSNDGDIVTCKDCCIVLYSFVNGIKLKDDEFTEKRIIDVAEYLRKLHSIGKDTFNLPRAPFEIASDRHSVLHFDITKQNIFVNEEKNKICFIDFDDAKFGPAVFDVAIAIANLFISKATGTDKKGIDLFINSYYKDDEVLKQKEIPLIKKAGIIWLNSIINNPNFDTSTREGLQNKLDCMKKFEK